MHLRCCRPVASWVHYTTSCNTQSSAPEDGQNNCPKHVDLTGIINKPLLLHLVGCLNYLYQWCRVIGQNLSAYCHLTPVCIIPPICYNHLHLHNSVTGCTNKRSLRKFKKQYSFKNRYWLEIYFQNFSLFNGSSINQAVRCRPVGPEAKFCTQFKINKICGVQTGKATGLSLNTTVFPLWV